MRRFWIGFALGISMLACAPGEKGPETSRTQPPAGYVVNIVARGLSFEGPAEIPSGWTTFRFSNESSVVHFALIERLPAGQGIDAQQKEIAPVFQQGLDLLNAGDADAAMAKFGELPGWFGEVVFLGGPGLTSPGHVSQATVHLDPGTYLLECYVKTAGIFHSYNPDPAVYGMVHEFTVTPAVSDGAEPTAALHLDISSTTGVTMDTIPSVGSHIVAVDFSDQIVHENFVGHDVHLARLADTADLNRLEQWMDWRQPAGLETPAPVEFLGGLNEMPAGSVGYLAVDLDPGTYAWIAEVPGARAKGMLRTFTVGAAPGHAGLTDFATRYAAAWSSQNPDRLASFYAEDGSLAVNAGAPSVGRAAIRATAQGFMTAFPDMRVTMDSMVGQGDHAVFYWTWTGTNTGPGGTGRAVRLSGYEEWTLGPARLIAESKGHYDEEEYRRQVSGTPG